MSFEGLLLHKCDIYRPVTAENDYGETTKSSETLISADVACRFAEKSEKRVFDQDAEDLIVTRYLLLVPSATDIQERDIVRNIELDSSTTVSGPFFIEMVMNRFGGTAMTHKSATIRLIDQ